MNEYQVKEPIYVFGHRNPDTDSIVSSMAYAALMNAMGSNEYVPARLGHINDETSFLLEHFGFEAPRHLRTVRTQVRDIDFDRPPQIAGKLPVSHAWNLLRKDRDLSAIPVTDDNGALHGMVTMGSIAEQDLHSITEPHVQDIPIFNLLSALEGNILNDEENVFDSISGDVMICMPEPAEQPEQLSASSIVICGEQPETVERALTVGASCVILCQTDLAEKYMGISSETCLITTPYDAYRAARMIFQAIPVSRLCADQEIVSFHLDDLLDDVRDTVLESRFRAYPILDENDNVIGTLSRYHLLRPRRKRVVLMDHNERSQSVDGLEEADILAIIDHHRLADVQTSGPIFMRNEPIGSSTSIVASMYQERGLMPSPKLAGLMVAAILSDTVLFKSPTCTDRDKRLAERLARIAGIDMDELGRQIFSVGAITEKPVKEILSMDFKEFLIADHRLGIGQVTCLDVDGMLKRLPELVEAMQENLEKRGYTIQILMLTDVLRVGTEIVFVGDEDIVRNAFNINAPEAHHAFLPGVVSRKKQIVPALALLWG